MDDILAKKNRHLFLEEKDNTHNSFISNINYAVENIDTIKTFNDNVNSGTMQHLLETYIEQVGTEGNAWILRLTELGESILATTSGFNYASVLTVTQDIEAGATITLPEAMKYRVGTHMLLVSWNGTVCYNGEQYEEVGAFNERSAVIKIKQNIKTGDKLEFRTVALSDTTSVTLALGNAIDNYPIIINNIDTGRTIAERFSDITNVKNFGAKGDGVTDDTAAFASAAEDGVPVFVPEGNYVVAGGNGKFLSIDDVFASKLNAMSNVSQLLCVKPKDCGGDFANQTEDDARAWPAVHQGCFVDPYDDIMYASNTNGSNKTRLVVSKWSSQESEREFIAYSPYEYNWVSHQSLSFYRPSKAHQILICCTKSPYVDASTTNLALTEMFNMWKFDYNHPSTHTLYKSFRIVSSSERKSDSTVQAAVSFDGKYLVAFYTDANSDSKIKVWKMSDVVSLESGTDISSSYLYKFSHSGTTGGQGISCDGVNIYCFSGANSTIITTESLDGKVFSGFTFSYLLNKPLSDFTSYNGTTPTALQSETESVFFAKYGNKMCVFVNVVHKAYNLSDSESFSRYNRFYCLSVPEDRALQNSAYEPYRLADTSVNNANYLYNACIAMPYSDCTNLPVAATGYLQSICYPVTTQNARQIYWGVGTNVENVFTRLLKSDNTAATDWYKFVTSDSENIIQHPIGVLSNILAPYSDSTLTSLIFKLQNRYEANYTNTYGFIGRYRKNVTPGSENVNSQITLGTVEGGNAGDGYYIFRIFQNNGTVSDGDFCFSKTNTVSLGNADHTWSNVYATTGPWVSSDARLKENIEEPSEALMRAWGKVRFKVFQMKDALEKKGASARVHTGVIAQEVQDSFASEGLDARRYGLFGYDQWEDEYEDVEVIDSEAVVDDDGNEISPAVTHVEQRLIRYAGDKFSIRYEEALALECAYQRWLGEQRDAKIEALMQRISALENNQ